MEKIVQTAGRTALGEFAPEFAHYNDDVLFGENWNNQDIDVKTRSIITVVALMASGITDSSLKFHLMNAKNHGVTQKEIAAIITHVAFYAGWPKGWAVFNLAKEVWQVGEGDAQTNNAQENSAQANNTQENNAQANNTQGNSAQGADDKEAAKARHAASMIFPIASRMWHTPSILSDRAIWHRFPSVR